jgi:hypothetical protein
MLKPAFVFDGRNILDANKLEEIEKYYGKIQEFKDLLE